jgi:hypothetical protein
MLLRLLFPVLLAIVAIAALDGGRYQWSRMSWWFVGVGYALLTVGTAVTAWAQAVNRFFEPVLRQNLVRFAGDHSGSARHGREADPGQDDRHLLSAGHVLYGGLAMSERERGGETRTGAARIWICLRSGASLSSARWVRAWW